MDRHITLISVQHEGTTATAEIETLPDMEAMTSAFRGLLVAVGFHPDLVEEWMPMQDDSPRCMCDEPCHWKD